MARSCFCICSCQDEEAWKVIVANVCLGDTHVLACSPTHNLGDLGNLFEFWERRIVLINFGINKDLELVLCHYLGVKM